MKLKLFTKTFTKNEFRTILGKRMSNFWILLVVFLCSIGALEFSRAGMRYLEYKMSDPFINWVEIQEQGEFKLFSEEMRDTAIRGEYNIGDYEENFFEFHQIWGIKGKYRADGRTIAFNSRLLDRILDEDNIVIPPLDPITDCDYGWIVTQELMERLGYDDPQNYPVFINIATTGDTTNIREWGLTDYGEGKWMSCPVPILAVVKQLPNLLDFMAPRLFYAQWNNKNTRPFDYSAHPEYYGDLKFVVSDTSGVAAAMRTILDEDSVQYGDYFEPYTDYRESIIPAHLLRIVIYDSVFAPVNHAAQRIVDAIPGVTRYYDYAFGNEFKGKINYISIMFDDLGKVSDFSKWARDNYAIRIDMAQIEAKENFKTFNILASVLCVAIMILSVLFVTIFLWFLIDSHFRAISKNLGTIMAFGLPNRTIIHIYLRVFLRMVLCSLVIAVVLLGVTELVLSLLGVERAGGMHYIILNDAWVWALIVIIPLLTTVVVTLTMRGKLKAKPGDLIFERNN